MLTVKIEEKLNLTLCLFNKHNELFWMFVNI